MVILHIVLGKCNPDRANGVNKTVYFLAKFQKQLGHEVHVYGISNKVDRHQIIDQHGLEVEVFPLTRSRFLLSRELVGKIKENHVDIAHLHSVYIPENISLGRLFSKCFIPYVVTPNGGISSRALKYHAIRKRMYRYIFDLNLLNNAAAIHALTHQEASDARNYGVTTSIFVAPNGIDFNSIPADLNTKYLEIREPRLRKTFKFVFCGRLDPVHKGLDVLIHGFAIAVKTSTCQLSLVLIGPDWKGNQRVLENLTAQLGISDSVFFLGPIYGREKFDALAIADVYIQTSRWEGVPFSVLEALACGKPCIVTHGTNVGQDVLDYNAGLVASEPNPDKIADRITKIVSIENLTKMGINARRLIKEKYDWSKIAETICIAYENVLISD